MTYRHKSAFSTFNMGTYNFKTKYEKSIERRKKDIAIIAKAFNVPEDMVMSTNEGWDKKGIDYVVLLRDGRSAYIDVKYREKGVSKFWNHTYKCKDGRTIKQPELTLEILSNVERNTPGWTLDMNKFTDFVLFVFDESDCENAYIFKFLELRDVLIQYMREWEREFRIGESYTPFCSEHPERGGYHTQSMFVPICTVLKALKSDGILHSGINHIIAGGSKL